MSLTRPSPTQTDGKERERPIFLVGAPRSGTTLLQYMLRSHPRISLPTGESHFFIPLFKSAERFGDLRRKDNVVRVLDEMYRRSASFLETDLHGLRFEVDPLAQEFHDKGLDTIPKIIAGLYQKNSRGEGKPRWGEKTPYYVLHIPTLLEMFPDAQIIHIIRDGRDCALSLFGRKHDFKVYNTYFAAKYWQHYVEVGCKAGSRLPTDTYLEIKYEDILLHAEDAIRNVCSFLGESYQDSVVHYKKAGEAGKTPLLQKPLNKENAEKWRKKMSKRQLRIFEGAAGSTLKSQGYPLVTTANPLPLPLRGIYRVHNDLVTWASRNILRRRKKRSRGP